MIFKRRLITYVVIGLLVSVLVLQSVISVATAASHIGLKYFAGTPAPLSETNNTGRGYQLFYYGIPPEARDKASFLSYVESMYNGTNPVIQEPRQVGRYAVAAAYIIRTMIGSPVGSSKILSAAEIADWKARVNSPNISLSTGAFNAGVNTGITTTSLANVGSQFYDVVQFNDATAVDSLLFRDSSRGGAVTYALQLYCANPLGNLSLPPPSDYNLTPTVDVGPESTESGGGSATVTPTVTNGGATASDPAQWQVTKFIVRPGLGVPGAGDSGQLPVQYYGNNATTISSGSQSFNRNQNNLPVVSDPIGDYDVGTKVCYALSVQPITQNNANWRHSAPDCIVIAKKPKIQVHGGDIRAGANFVDQTAVTSSFIRTGQTIKTGGSPSAARTFGSWGEYAVSATGVITGIGSGSAFAGQGLANSSSCSFTFLTFTNGGTSNCKSGAALGGYSSGATLPDIAATYPASSSPVISGSQNIAALSGTYRTLGAPLTLTGGVLPVGRTVIINTFNPTSGTYGDVTISGNLTYTTDTLVTSADIPQLVIIANNIGIQGGVSQVDAWLVARGTLNTCSDIARTAINSNNCNAVLSVNGPVTANQINFWRTGGSGTGASSGDPSEIFNLRPDAYLWGIDQSSKSGRLQTVYEHELPPRY